ncbi:MAG: LPS export ABC transporter periplasmic protein LptC [Bacteroidales bacterium]|nr:LPS export ABC transporter periplasmic protein LptC [Bacteroidales bacterium]
MATAAAVAFVVFSCRGKLSEAEKLDLSVTPLQRVDSMFFVQTENGRLKLRVEAGAMEKYETDSLDYELFPEGFRLYGYANDGNLETIIVADEARHDKANRATAEIWKAYGNVVVRNVIKQERIETDTLYWDRAAQEIFTDCYVKLFSPSGFMQGYGMRSDEMARNSIVHRPFDSYGVVVQDSTEVVIDTANFIGPLLKK